MGDHSKNGLVLVTDRTTWYTPSKYSRLVNGFRHGAVSFFEEQNELTVVITTP